jgi:hypothetical protein
MYSVIIKILSSDRETLISIEDISLVYINTDNIKSKKTTKSLFSTKNKKL